MDNIASEELTNAFNINSATVINTTFTKGTADKVVRAVFSGNMLGSSASSRIDTVTITVGSTARTYNMSQANNVSGENHQVWIEDWFDVSEEAEGSITISIVVAETNVNSREYSGSFSRNKDWATI